MLLSAELMFAPPHDTLECALAAVAAHLTRVLFLLAVVHTLFLFSQQCT